MFKMKVFIFLLINLLTVYSNDLVAVETEASVSDDDSTDVTESTDEVFVPTLEWQEIKPGQAIPQGLHVRINMETGKKEAKILNNNGKEEEGKDAKTMDRIDRAELKEALKKMKDDARTAGDDAINAEEIKNKFRSMDELKVHMKDLEMKVETDVEIMRNLVKVFEETEDVNEKVDTVETLEYYVHQFDNAIDFLNLQGVEKILVPSLNSTMVDLQEKAGFLIGSAAQSNPKVQIKFLESGLVTTLLRLITGQNSPAVSSKALYGLSAILRNFPEAQYTFLRQGGLDVLRSVFKIQGKPMDNIKIKILTLIQDLLDERRNLDLSTEAGISRRDQYSRIDLEDLLYTSGWCQVFQLVLVLPRDDRRAKREDLLTTMSEEFPLRVEHDSIEKILNAMLGMKKFCAKEFTTNTELSLKLKELSRQYEELSAREEGEGDSDNYFSSLLATINLVQESHNIKIEL